MGGEDWMIQGREGIKAAEKRQQKIQKARRRAPEVYLKDGETKLFRFRTSEPVGIFRYRARVGKYHQYFTQPAHGDRDLFAESGLEASLAFCYEVFDRTGYVDKKTGKRIKNIPRFFWCSGRTQKAIEKINQKKGGLVKFDIEVSREGADKSTTYTFYPEDNSALSGEMLKAPRLMDEFADYYAPKDEEAQRLILSGVLPEDDDEDESSVPRKKKHRDEDEDDD
jgi:hypothetical protein